MVKFTPIAEVICRSWPVFISMGVFRAIIRVARSRMVMLLARIVVLLMVAYGWLIDYTIEVVFFGHITCLEACFIKIGIVLFIMSEVMLFFGIL